MANTNPLCASVELVEAIEAWQQDDAREHMSVALLDMLLTARLRPEQEVRAEERGRCASWLVSAAEVLECRAAKCRLDYPNSAGEMARQMEETAHMARDVFALGIRANILGPVILASTPPSAPASEPECCDECGFPPARGNVVYLSSGRRPLCRECNPSAPATVLDPAVVPLIRAVRAYRRAPSYDWFMRFGDIGEAYDALPAAWREAAQRGVPRG